MGKLDSCTRCVRFCKGHCTGQFIFRIFTLLVLVLATILQGTAIAPDTVWDTFEQVLETKSIIGHDVEISSYQTLYDVTVLKDVAQKDSSFVPSVYPVKKEDFDVEWKKKVSSFETTSQGIGIGAIVVLENALLIHFLIPESYFSKFFQPIALVTTMLMCGASGALSILGAISYDTNHQQVFYPNSGPTRIKVRAKQLEKYGFSYKFDKNECSTGYKLALAAGSMYCLCGVLCIVILIEYSIGRYKMWKKAKTVDYEKKEIPPNTEQITAGKIKDKKAFIKNNNDQMIVEDVDDRDIKGNMKKTGLNEKEKNSKTDVSKKG